MGAAKTPDSDNGFKNSEEWVICKNCGLEYPKSWSRCSVCRTGATVTKRHGGLIAGVVVAVFFILGAYGFSQTKGNSLTGPGSLLHGTEAFSEPSVQIPQTGLYQSQVDQECVADFDVSSYEESPLCYIKLVDVSNESNVISLFINPGEKASTEVPLGSYEMLCATGNIWYGPRYLFGPETRYTKADKVYVFKQSPSGGFDGWTVDMTPQEKGNLYMDEVSKGQW